MQTEWKDLQGPLTQRVFRHSNTTHLSKAYSDLNAKYTGNPTDNFNQEFALFIKRGKQAKIDDEDDRRKAVSIMLTGDARKYYFQTLKPKTPDLASLIC